jgi:small-conductance mechanosensitive channel
MGLLARRFFPRLGFDAGASDAFASLTFYALLGVAFLFALRAVNIPLTAFAVVGGALALGIGFGSQAIVSNFISGLLLFEIRFWIRYDDRTDRSAILSDIRFRIDALFEENGIVIAFPQMHVHLAGSNGVEKG